MTDIIVGLGILVFIGLCILGIYLADEKGE